jgi:hypothetical protein
MLYYCLNKDHSFLTCRCCLKMCSFSFLIHQLPLLSPHTITPGPWRKGPSADHSDRGQGATAVRGNWFINLPFSFPSGGFVSVPCLYVSFHLPSSTLPSSFLTISYQRLNYRPGSQAQAANGSRREAKRNGPD